MTTPPLPPHPPPIFCLASTPPPIFPSFVLVPPQDAQPDALVALTITGQATAQEADGRGVYTKYTATVAAFDPSVVYARTTRSTGDIM